MSIVSGTFSAAGQSASLPVNINRMSNVAGQINIVLRGGSGTVQLERSYDQGANWDPVTYIDGSAMAWSGPVCTSWSESEEGMIYRLNCTSYASPITYRLSAPD